jgi:diapolycopene oxygenase
MKTVAIVGAGVGGLATAIRMAHKGYDVKVFEANPYPGGKLTEIQLGAYRFDAGPSLCTLPNLIDDLFTLTGRNPRDFIRFIPLPVACNYFWSDGTTLAAWQNPEKLASEVEKQLNVPASVVKKALEHSRKLFELSGQVFLEHSLHKLKTYLNPKVLRAFANFPVGDLMKTMHVVNTERLTDPRLVQYFDRFATYNGSSPYLAPGVLSLIPHLEHGIGAVVPEGGMISITHALERLAKELGVVFHYNSQVSQILVQKKKAVGIVADGVEHKADIVVSNMDIVPTYTKLMPNQKRPERTLAQERSSSALIFYWGIGRSFPELDLHNIFFSSDYAREFQHIFEEKTIPEEPTIYVNIGSKYAPEDAPSGKENWFVMLNVPADQGQDWDALIPEARKRTLAIFSKRLGVDIESLIEEEDYLSPQRIEQRTSSWQGALYGTSSNSRFAAFLRHPNFSFGVSNLYFCGGSVHPGGGIPLCLYSARLVDQLTPAANR